ncbi:hypothetical protein P8H26_15460 [Pseudochrobactrum sp. sp1633]|uniref:hypothetical protein n=1 Tax=Pseudochrobactrum sp. sp1633 TaxID=3036706 RepID=UPI0025A60484|nr:hypothetical protein [Pseudochrobactrum sp. sp1633]MDM8346787.1 hypothetical protein [Pseudochrobactrum sp. sp1633]HWD14058.1 hypothetical protein [Pseudochrobactrum sp.]
MTDNNQTKVAVTGCVLVCVREMSLKNWLFFLLLALLLLVTAFFNVLLNPAPPRYPSIGGGGYDLSGFVYTLSLLLFTCAWSVIMLIAGLCFKNPVIARRLFILAIIGALTFIVTLVLYHGNLQ